MKKEYNKDKYLKIKSIKHLISRLDNEGYNEFVIVLGGGGVVSRKEMMYDPADKMFLINNCIDDSEQDLTEKQLLNKNYTNIGVAIKRGAFFEVL